MPEPQEGERSSGLPVGYRWHEGGGISSLPWPDDVADLPPSLGPHVIAWIEGRTDEPGLIHHLSKEPLRLTKGQKRFIHLYYALAEDGASWLYRRAIYRRAKGCGKDPTAAMLCLAEAVGPVRPSGRVLDSGFVVGKPVGMSLVQIAANSEDQGKDTLRVMNNMMSTDFLAFYNADVGKLQTYFGSGSLVEVLPNSEATAEGDPATFVLLNESHHMTQASGRHRLAAVARRNTAKSPGGMARMVEMTNAHMPGELSVAEQTFESWQAQAAGRTVMKDILFDSLEAKPGLDISSVDGMREGIMQAYAEAPWISVDRILADALDIDTPVYDSVRFYHNSIPESLDAWMPPSDWDACGTGEPVRRGQKVTMFLDCSKSDDGTALVVCRLKDGCVSVAGYWQRPPGLPSDTPWMVPRQEVDDTVRSWLATGKVQWFGVDPSPAKENDSEALYWQTLIDGWHREFGAKLPYWATPGKAKGNSVLWDMRNMKHGGREHIQRFTEECELTRQAVLDKTFVHDADSLLKLHVCNARIRLNQFGSSIGKPSRGSSQKIDLAVAMVGARYGLRTVMDQEASKKKKKQRALLF